MEGPDFSSIIAAVSVGALSAGLIAMGVVKIGPNVTKWAVNKLAGFFGK